MCIYFFGYLQNLKQYRGLLKMKNIIYILFIIFSIPVSCKKNDTSAPQPLGTTKNPGLNNITINNVVFNTAVYNINKQPIIKISFTQPILSSSLSSAIQLAQANGNTVSISLSLQNSDSTIIIQPTANLNYLTQYNLTVNTNLKSASGGNLQSAITGVFATAIDSSRKYPAISDEALLDTIQKRTFKYFWDLGDSPSGMARERASDNVTVTTGGTGFGIMAIPVAINRGFISRTDGLARIQKIVNFLSTKCQRWHGAFSHWVNGSTGATIPFGNNNGADIVETSYLMMGLLTVRQYFNSTTDPNEIVLRDSINAIWKTVEWNWFTQNGNSNSLYWQYNPSYSATNDIWSIAVTGWNEALITYVLAASSPTHSIDKNVYDVGWTVNGNFKNGKTFYNYTLPLGPDYGGPLFFEHYSFMGINPKGLTDNYGIDYTTQTKNHTLINNNYCTANPKNYYGYSDSVWGLTASDINGDYNASSPTNDKGYIAPTAAISSISYTPAESMAALKFFYYVLGDKIFKEYGFVDAFGLDPIKTGPWYANSFLAIDQGPIIVMIENYRTGLLWNLFMSCPEVKEGMQKLGFSSSSL